MEEPEFYYSASTGGFHLVGLSDEADLPSDVVKITHKRRMELIEKKTDLTEVKPDMNGYPILVKKVFTLEEAQAKRQLDLELKYRSISRQPFTFNGVQAQVSQDSISSLMSLYQTADMLDEESVTYKHLETVYVLKLADFKALIRSVVHAQKQADEAYASHKAHLSLLTTADDLIKYNLDTLWPVRA